MKTEQVVFITLMTVICIASIAFIIWNIYDYFSKIKKDIKHNNDLIEYNKYKFEKEIKMIEDYLDIEIDYFNSPSKYIKRKKK